MKSSTRIGRALTALAAATAVLAALSITFTSQHNHASAATRAPQQPAAVDPVTASQIAWFFFILAMEPSGTQGSPLLFETWPEQCDLQPAICGQTAAAVARAPGAPRARFAHASFLAAHLGKRLGLVPAAHNPSVGCGSMNVNGFPGIPATNVATGAVFCEEVFVNPDEADFVKTNTLTTQAGQKKFGNVTFPAPSLEIKVDWVPTSSFKTPFNCPDNNVYTETIQFEGQSSQCYALVGIHISSKILPNWLWATFEPNYAITNPNRCKPNLYNRCYDPWGTTSKQPYGPGASVKQSPALATLMARAGLNKVFNNYFLTGAQTEFVNARGNPIPLGNSFVEYNAFVPPGQASCITCHNYAYLGTTSFGGPLSAPPPPWPFTGYACNQPNPTASCLPPSGQTWTSQDFSWMLGVMALVTPPPQ